MCYNSNTVKCTTDNLLGKNFSPKIALNLKREWERSTEGGTRKFHFAKWFALRIKYILLAKVIRPSLWFLNYCRCICRWFNFKSPIFVYLFTLNLALKEVYFLHLVYIGSSQAFWSCVGFRLLSFIEWSLVSTVNTVNCSLMQQYSTLDNNLTLKSDFNAYCEGLHHMMTWLVTVSQCGLFYYQFLTVQCIYLSSWDMSYSVRSEEAWSCDVTWPLN